jgi:SAM-dependent methyltransferase
MSLPINLRSKILKSQNIKDTKFETQNSNLFQVWDEIQSVQASFCFAQEISAYYMSKSWIKTAKNILDVGTGTGCFLKMLAERFPDKYYTGIDITKEFIEKAKRGQCSSNISFKVQNYFDVEDQFDFIIMRLFWQHIPLKELAHALIKLENITRQGSCVLISDSWDMARTFEPDLPEFNQVILAYTKQQISNDRDRNIIEILLKEFTQRNNWQVKCDLKFIIPSTVNNNLNLFRRIYDLWIKLFECLGDLKIDYSAAKDELEIWKKNILAYTQTGLRVVRVARL